MCGHGGQQQSAPERAGDAKTGNVGLHDVSANRLNRQEFTRIVSIESAVWGKENSHRDIHTQTNTNTNCPHHLKSRQTLHRTCHTTRAAASCMQPDLFASTSHLKNAGCAEPLAHPGGLPASAHNPSKGTKCSGHTLRNPNKVKLTYF